MPSQDFEREPTPEARKDLSFVLSFLPSPARCRRAQHGPVARARRVSGFDRNLFNRNIYAHAND
jgi:hypothetical protein